MHALRRSVWAEDLQGHLKALLARVPADPVSSAVEREALRPGFDASASSDGAVLSDERNASEAPDQNVVRPAVFKRDAAQASPRTRPELSAAVTTVLKASERIREVELQSDRKAQRALDVAFRSLAKLEEAEAKLETAYQEISGTREHANALEERVCLLSAQLAEANAAIERANARASAAETVAQEALDDLQHLTDHVSRMFAPAED